MNPAVIIRKDVRQVRVGDRFSFGGREREIISVRRCSMVILGASIPARELLHKCPHRAGVEYLPLSEGSLVAIIVR